MAFSLFSKGRRVINFIFNDHCIRFVEVKNTNPPVPFRWGEKFLPPGIISDGKIIDNQALSMILDECIEDWKIKRREVRFIVPDSAVIIRRLTIPDDVNDDEIKGYLYLELGSSIHLPFEEPIFDTIKLSASNGKKEIILFAAPEKIVLEFSALLSELKLKPVAADISPLANYRLYHALGSPRENDHLIVVQFDLNLVSMCIFEGEFPLFLRHVSVEMTDDWRIRLGHTGAEELSFIGEVDELSFQFEDVYKEINKLMDFYKYTFTQGTKEINKVYVNGDHPLFNKILHEMKERFEVPVEVIEVSTLETEKFDVFPRSHYLGLGLGLKEV